MIASAYEFGEVLVPFDGEESVKCAFVIMPLLGPSLSDIRKQGNVLSASCVCKLSERVLQCLRALHVNGFLHLDEKPSVRMMKDTSESNREYF
jgi:serine/threonine protein kinase